jgi:hypothetical protein
MGPDKSEGVHKWIACDRESGALVGPRRIEIGWAVWTAWKRPVTPTSSPPTSPPAGPCTGSAVMAATALPT